MNDQDQLHAEMAAVLMKAMKEASEIMQAACDATEEMANKPDLAPEDT